MATKTNTLIYEVKWDDGQAVKGSDAWTKRLKTLEKQAVSGLKGMSGGLDKFLIDPYTIAFNTIVSVAKTAFSAIAAIGKKSFELLSDAIQDTIKDTMSFEDSLVLARRTMDLSKTETKELGREMLKLSTEIGGIEVDRLNEIAGIAGTLGIRGTENIRDFVEAISKIDIATDIAAATAAERIPKILTIYQVATDKMGAATKDFGNRLNILGNTMNATQSQILTIAQTMAPAAQAFGFSVNELLAISAATATVSTKMGTAGNAFVQVVTKMSTNYSKFAEVLGIDSELLKRTIETKPLEAIRMMVDSLNEIGETQGPMAAQQALSDLGFAGVRTNTFMQAMRATFDQVDFALNQLNDDLAVNESLDKETAVAMDLLSKQMETFGNVVDNSQKLIGGPLVESMTKFLAEGLNPIVKGVFAWLEQSELVNTLLPRMTENARVLFDTLLTNALVFFDSVDFDAFFRNMHERFLEVTEALQSADWGAIFEQIKTTAKSAFDFITETLPTLIGLFKNFADLLVSLAPLIEPTFDTISLILKRIVQEFTPVIEHTQEFIDLVGSIAGAFKDPQAAIDSFFDGVVSSGLKAVETISNLVSKIKGMVSPIKEADKEATGNSLFPDIVTWGNKAAQTVGNLNSQIVGMTPDIINAAGALGQMTPQTQRTTQGDGASGYFSYLQAKKDRKQAEFQAQIDKGRSQASPVTNIHLSSPMMITDNSSQQKIVRQVSRVQTNQQARTVSGSSSGSGRWR